MTNHSACFQFPVDFDTKTVRGIPLGRFMLGDHCVRVWLTPKGLKIGIPREAIDEGFVMIQERAEDQIEFAGVPK